jgi:quercetin dioxygenase-like cupin family protein
MQTKKLYWTVLLVAGSATIVFANPKGKSAAQPQLNTAPQSHVMKTAGEMSWSDAPPSLPPGAKVILLEGDPAKEGFLAMRLKLPAGYKVPPHTHPGFERLTVIEGTFMLGHGEKWDQAAMKEWTPGSYVSMPPGMKHYAQAKTDTVVQLTTVGPWGITYLNPADDPRNAKVAK